MGMKYGPERKFEDGKWTHTERSLNRFKTDWNWLMPVVERIRALEEVENFNINITCDAIIEGHNLDIHVYGDNKDNTLSIIYKTVIEFIGWYNSVDKQS